MAGLWGETAKFTKGPNGEFVVHFDWPVLAWAAMTAGVSPLVPLVRSADDLRWRIATARAFLCINGDGWWAYSPAYDVLDPTEKGAVNYLLGNVQTRITSYVLLGQTYLTHLDALLRFEGTPLTGRRPDFLGVDSALTKGLTIESKARSGWVPAVVAAGKAQVRTLPVVRSVSVALGAVNFSYWGDDETWCFYMEDPPLEEDVASAVSAEEIAVAYYLPLMRFLLQGETYVETVQGVELRMIRLSAVDMFFGLPVQIYDLLFDVAVIKWSSGLPLAGTLMNELSIGDQNELGLTILGLVTDLSPKADRLEDMQDSRGFLGEDGVYVGLGSTWLE